jgi:hypothetical protein
MICALMGNSGRICMPPSLQTMSNLLFLFHLATLQAGPDRICMPSPRHQCQPVARAREPDRICMPSPCNLAKLVERACGPDRICMPSTTTRVKILAGPSGEDRICMPSPTKKINLVCTGRVLPKTIKLGLNKRQPQEVPSTARQRV